MKSNFFLGEICESFLMQEANWR